MNGTIIAGANHLADIQSSGGIDLSSGSSGQEIADYLRRYAISKKADKSVARPYLHDFIDVDTRFGNIGDKTGFGGMSSEISGFRKVNGSLVEVKIIPRILDFDGNYNPNTTDNRVGSFGIKEYKLGGRIYSDAYYNNASGSGLIVFTFRDQRAAAMELYKYITGQ